MRSSATEELLDDRAHFGLDDVRRLAGADQPDALGLGAENLEIALAHSPVKGQLLALEAVEPAALGAIALKPGARVEVEQQREVGHDAAGRARVELADQIGIDAAAVALVRDGGVGVPVTEHDAAAIEPRPDPLGDVLLPRGHEEEDLDERLGVHARSLEQPPHRDAEPCSIGLACVLDLATLPTKPALEPHHLGGLARPFDALERDQYAAHAPANLRRHDSTAPGRPGIARGRSARDVGRSVRYLTCASGRFAGLATKLAGDGPMEMRQSRLVTAEGEILLRTGGQTSLDVLDHGKVLLVDGSEHLREPAIPRGAGGLRLGRLGRVERRVEHALVRRLGSG